MVSICNGTATFGGSRYLTLMLDEPGFERKIQHLNLPVMMSLHVQTGFVSELSV